MRSVPIALTWEILQRGRLPLLMAILGANLLPLILLAELRVSPADAVTQPELITMQTVIVLLNITGFVAAIVSSIDFTPRAMTLPVTTSELVFWRIIPAMVLISLEVGASMALLNIVFDLNWPVLGPALLAPVSLAMVLAALWYAQRSPFLPFYVGIAGGIIGLWYKSRSGPMFSQPTHVWAIVTPTDVMTLLAFAVISYYFAVVGVARYRCGETPGSPALLAELQKLLNGPPRLFAPGSLSFRSPAEAQFWSEWHKKGWLLPFVVTFAIGFTWGIWIIFNRDPQVMMDGMIAGAGMLAAMGLIGGMIVGNLGPSETNCELGTFLATRPMTNCELARIAIRVAARTVLISWAIWVVAFAFVAAIMAATGLLQQSVSFRELRWWYFPASLLGCWIVASTTSLPMLAGRSVLWFRFVCAIVAVYVGALMFARTLDFQSRSLVYSSLMMLTGIASGMFALVATIVAQRRSMIEMPAIFAGAFAWLGISVVVIVECLRTPFASAPLAVLLVGLASLAVAPFAAAPLAIAWNRHR